MGLRFLDDKDHLIQQTSAALRQETDSFSANTEVYDDMTHARNTQRHTLSAESEAL